MRGGFSSHTPPVQLMGEMGIGGGMVAILAV